jgi:hypothetical protein
LQELVLANECDLATVHALLSKIPVDIPFEKLLVVSKKLYQRFDYIWFCNGKESTGNRALGGSTYPGQKLVRSSLCKKILVVMKHSNLYLVLVLPSGG